MKRADQFDREDPHSDGSLLSARTSALVGTALIVALIANVCGAVSKAHSAKARYPRVSGEGERVIRTIVLSVIGCWESPARSRRRHHRADEQRLNATAYIIDPFSEVRIFASARARGDVRFSVFKSPQRAR